MAQGMASAEYDMVWHLDSTTLLILFLIF